MVKCVRCDEGLIFRGVKEVREERRREILSDQLEGVVYVCPKCGAIELFDPEIGQELRRENPIDEQRES